MTEHVWADDPETAAQKEADFWKDAYEELRGMLQGVTARRTIPVKQLVKHIGGRDGIKQTNIAEMVPEVIDTLIENEWLHMGERTDEGGNLDLLMYVWVVRQVTELGDLDRRVAAHLGRVLGPEAKQ